MGFENIRSFLAEVLVVVKKVKKEEMTREEETIFSLILDLLERCFSSVLQHLRRHSVMFALPVQKSALAFLVHP